MGGRVERLTFAIPCFGLHLPAVAIMLAEKNAEGRARGYVIAHFHVPLNAPFVLIPAVDYCLHPGMIDGGQ